MSVVKGIAALLPFPHKNKFSTKKTLNMILKLKNTIWKSCFNNFNTVLM